MWLSDAYLRAGNYLRKHGLKKTASRFLTQVKRQILVNREVVFWLDLSTWSPEARSADGYSVVSIERTADIPEAFRALLAQEYPAELQERDNRRRLGEGATLWCLRRSTEFIGFTWTVPGKTLKPYYFPLTPRDVHIIANFIFPAYRGQRLNSVLMQHVLHALKTAGAQRAYIETAEWNEAELRSLDRSGFIRLGRGSRRARQGRTVVTWWS